MFNARICGIDELLLERDLREVIGGAKSVNQRPDLRVATRPNGPSTVRWPLFQISLLRIGGVALISSRRMNRKHPGCAT